MKTLPEKPVARYPDKILMLMDTQYFFSWHEEIKKEFFSYRNRRRAEYRAWECLEGIYSRHFGKNKYANFESFRVARDRFRRSQKKFL